MRGELDAIGVMNVDSNDRYYAYNHLTEERRPITEDQYQNDTNITDDGRLAI